MLSPPPESRQADRSAFPVLDARAQETVQPLAVALVELRLAVRDVDLDTLDQDGLDAGLELQEVAVGDDEVRDLARREAAEVLLDAEDPRRVVRDRAQRLLGREPERGRGRRLEREVAL